MGPTTWLAAGRDVNWILAVDGTDVTLVDTGYPGYANAVAESLDLIGRSVDDVVAVLITHSHVDHIGGVPALLAHHRMTVRAGRGDLPVLRGERQESATVSTVAANAWRPGVVPWALRISRMGATDRVLVSAARAVDDGVALDVPGRPVPVSTPGHTSGHTCYLFPELGAVATGDALVTGHATSGRTGPQLLLPMFHHDRAGVRESLDVLAEVEADVLLPGHGPVHHAPIAAAVAQAR